MTRLILLASLLLSATASAQTYVRPSKGAPITIASSVAATSVAATYTASALFDWSSFAGVIITVNQTGQGTFSNCKYGVRVQALGSSTTNAADFFLLNVANNDYKASTSQAWYIRVLPGYLRFSIGTYQAASAGAPACSYKVTATPLPFDYAGQLLSTGVTSGRVLGGCTEVGCTYATVNATSVFPYLRIQNVGSDVAFCAPVAEDGTIPASTASFPIVLRPSSQPNAVIEITNWVGTLKCIGELGIFAH